MGTRILSLCLIQEEEQPPHAHNSQNTNPLIVLTMNQYDEAVEKLIDSIIVAAVVINTNPKAEAYIRSKIANIYHVGKEVGKMEVTNEIFNGSH